MADDEGLWARQPAEGISGSENLIADAINLIADAINVRCAACGDIAVPTADSDLYEHPPSTGCAVQLLDSNGMSLDHVYFIATDGCIYMHDVDVTTESESADSVGCAPLGRPTESAPSMPASFNVLVDGPGNGESIADATSLIDDLTSELDAASIAAVPVAPNDVVLDVEAARADADENALQEPNYVPLPDAPPPRKRRLPKHAKETEEGDVLIPLDRDPSIVSVDKGLVTLFAEVNVPRLGGASGDLGWSSFSAYQKCPYYFRRMYLDGLRGSEYDRPSKAIEIGSTVHTFLALYYQKIIDPNYPLDPMHARDRLYEVGCDAEVLMEAWRVFSAYEASHQVDYLIPLAVEYHVVDEATRQSARYDLVARIDKPPADLPAGTYVVESKTAGRFDSDTLDGWKNDGEVLGQIMLWRRLKLSQKFGKFQGVLVNILGKQKVPQFHRTFVPAQRWQINQHADDLRVWQGMRSLALATDSFPRARANCLSRYGKCSQWFHCAEGEK